MCSTLPADKGADSITVLSLVTFQGAVVYPLLNLGLFHQVGGFLGEDELPETRPEPVSVILHHWHTVLWEGHTQAHCLFVFFEGQRHKLHSNVTVGYLDVLMLHDLEHFNVYVFCTLIQHY